MLAQITVPVLLLRGSHTGRWFSESVQYVTENLRQCRIREIQGAGHFGPYTKAEVVAEELARFFG